MAGQACKDCRTVCGKGRVTMESMVKMEEAYEILEKGESESLLKKHLKRGVFDKLKELQTPLGSTLLDCIQSGVSNLDSGIGVYAADKDAYAVFRELFDPIIEEYHRFKSNQKHPMPNWGNPCDLTAIDPDGKYVISTRVRCGRNIEGFNFNPTMTEQQYVELEKKVATVLNSLQGEFKGTYYPLKAMTKTEQEKLIDDHFLFKEGDRFLQAGNAVRFWPKGRGIFYTPKKNFLVWVCEEDHMRLISMQNGGNLREVYKRLMDGVSEIENVLDFSRSDRLGYLTFCPTNLGTTIRASVHIKLPKLSKDMKKMEALATKYHLQIRGSAGEHSESPTGVYDISNKRRLGLTEFEAIKEMNDGILALIKEEESM